MALCCACCGGADLAHPPDLRSGVKLVYERPAAAWFMAPGYIPALVVACRTCGHLMLFERAAYKAWSARGAG
jgi:hypothetical protein